MPDLRLEGTRLRLVRAVAENPALRKALWKVVSKDFHIDMLEGLPASALGKVEEVPVPLVGAPPRHWGDGTDLGLPTTSRCTGAKLREAYASGQTTPVEVLDRVYDVVRREAFAEMRHSPFVTLDPERARAAAKASAARWHGGAPLSAIDGIPVPIKDEFMMAGLPAYGGTAWRSQRFHQDAVVIAQLRERGAVLPGTSHATENGMNPLGFNPNHLMPHNVYSAGHGAGGSSTGSGAAVGIGLATAALGSDGGGSIRIPAAMNGVFGLKPTFNRVSSTGDLWKGTVGHNGPLGQSVSDLVDLLDTASGYDPDDPNTHFAPDWSTVRPTWRTAIGRGIRGCRIGVLHEEYADADPRIVALVMQTLRALEAEGAVLIDVAFDHAAVVNAIGPILIASDSAANAASDMAVHRREASDELRMVYGIMAAIDAPLYLLARRARTGVRERAAAMLAGLDLLAMPTHARLAAPQPATARRQVADTTWTAAMTRFNFLGNLTGLPALTAPIGMVDGLPVGMQFLGDAWDEASCIAAGAHVERLGISQLPLPPGYVDLLG